MADHLDEKQKSSVEQYEHTTDSHGNLVYENTEEEPELHARTWIAMSAMFLLNLVQVFALQGPPSVVCPLLIEPYLRKLSKYVVSLYWDESRRECLSDLVSVDLSHEKQYFLVNRKLTEIHRCNRVPNSLSLVQAVLGPVISFASDTFQARKIILVTTCMISFVGSAIAPGAQSIFRLIGAQVLIGVGFAAVPLAYCVPSEILPRRWRPMAQALMNVAASIGAISGPLSIGTLTNNDLQNGWRKFYWIQFALWGATAFGILVGYRPPKRHTDLDNLSLMQKIGKLDLIGAFLLTAGLALFLTGLNLGGGLYTWSDSQTLGTLISGLVILLGFAIYEWKGTKTGILHHELFQGGKTQGRTFALCVVFIFIEGILLFSYIIFYPVL